ncbi:MAG TPA: hypothetical protein VJI75_02885 [Candidatus Nanoarchaeia archaeon]|nr:hypothetical protein [Candidatus Nanoarchaeia archaeon]
MEKEMMLWIFRLVLFGVVIGFIVLLRMQFITVITSSGGIEHAVYLKRAISKVSFEDTAINRAYEGIVIPEKITDEDINIGASTKSLGMMMQLKDETGSIIAGPAFWNRDQYDLINPLVPLSNNRRIEQKEYVLFLKDKELHKGLLEIQLVYRE